MNSRAIPLTEAQSPLSISGSGTCQVRGRDRGLWLSDIAPEADIQIAGSVPPQIHGAGCVFANKSTRLDRRAE